jgi:hypothetical protein
MWVAFQRSTAQRRARCSPRSVTRRGSLDQIAAQWDDAVERLRAFVED